MFSCSRLGLESLNTPDTLHTFDQMSNRGAKFRLQFFYVIILIIGYAMEYSSRQGIAIYSQRNEYLCCTQHVPDHRFTG
jgi:hypothetical protein